MKKIRITITIELNLDDEFSIEQVRRDLCLRHGESYIIPEMEFLAAKKDGGKALAFNPVQDSEGGLSETLYGSINSATHSIEELPE